MNRGLHGFKGKFEVFEQEWVKKDFTKAESGNEW
jgi:hypothetical protein